MDVGNHHYTFHLVMQRILQTLLKSDGCSGMMSVEKMALDPAKMLKMPLLKSAQCADSNHPLFNEWIEEVMNEKQQNWSAAIKTINRNRTADTGDGIVNENNSKTNDFGMINRATICQLKKCLLYEQRWPGWSFGSVSSKTLSMDDTFLGIQWRLEIIPINSGRCLTQNLLQTLWAQINGTGRMENSNESCQFTLVVKNPVSDSAVAAGVVSGDKLKAIHINEMPKFPLSISDLAVKIHTLAESYYYV